MNLAWLEPAVAAGHLRPLDLHLAQWLGRIGGDADPARILAAALTSRRLGEGDVCLDLAAYAGQPAFADLPEIQAPPLADWRRQLRAWPVVGGPGAYAPLILDGADRLYLGRYWHYEHQVAEAVTGLATEWVDEPDTAGLAARLDRLFPPAADGRVDWQRVAAVMALRRRFCVISGGPGTGKTRTVTAILALLVEQAMAAGRTLRIGLAAPTGKAAARLTESIRGAKARLAADGGFAEALVAAIPDEALTLHRLLGIRPGRVQPRHHAGNPLHLDLLVVDEASMVDLPLMARLFAARPAAGRLILLGDRDQLASVEAGMVLGDLCGQGREPAYSPRLRAALTDLAGGDWPVSGSPSGSASGSPSAAGATEGGAPPPLTDSLVLLRKSYRFQADSGIFAAADAVNRGDGEGALLALRGGYPDVALHTLDEAGLSGFLSDFLVPRYRACLAAGDPEAVLAAFGGFRILCAVREGPFGVTALNRLAETVLERAGVIRRDGGPLYPGRPLLVTSNDYDLGLFNGDVGLLRRDGEGGVLRAWFMVADGLKRLPPNRLPPNETVFAMTVHKSQGSEFDEVVLVLPRSESRVLTRELLYTGLTRARHRVTVIAPPERIREAAARPVRRSSGLYDALWDPSRGVMDQSAIS